MRSQRLVEPGRELRGVAGTPQFYADLPATAKSTLAILMLLGRLELFTVLVLLSPAFWRA